MYAVVAIGSRIRRSACGMNFRTFCCAAAVVQAHGPAAVAISAAAANQRKWRVMESPPLWNLILSLEGVLPLPSERVGEGQRASGSGLYWNCTAIGRLPLPPSRSHGVRS